MNDPHVVALHYLVESGPHGPTYDNPPPVCVPKPEFDLELREGRAVASMKVHCATPEEAVVFVKPLLTAWEIDTALRSGGRPQLRFTYDRAEVVDRNPTPRTLDPLTLSATGVGSSATRATLTTAASVYPAPPTYMANADLQTLWFRYSLYKEGRDSLTGMAYFCLTTLEGVSGGNRTGVAQTFGIASSVLNTLARLTSAVGDGRTARKWSKAGEARPHTKRELDWIDAAVRMLIRRVGEHAAGAPLRKLTMADLPPVS